MATGDLIFGDSFQDYITAVNTLPPRWTAAVSLSSYNVGPIGASGTLIPMFGGDATFCPGGTAGDYLSKTGLANAATGTFAFYYRTGNVVNNATIIAAVEDGGTLQIELRHTAAGLLTVTRNATVLATSVNALVANTVYHIEWTFTIDNANGTYEVLINGSSVNWIPAATGKDTQNTANAQFNGIRIYSYGVTVAAALAPRFAHLTLREGISILGPAILLPRYPTGAGNYAQWVGNYAQNFFNVAETYPDDDVTFNQSQTATDKDSFDYQNVPTGTIAAVQIIIRARQDAGTGHIVRPFVRIAGTNYFGSNIVTGASWVSTAYIWTLSPATGIAWTAAEVSGAEFGYEFVS